MSNSSFHLGECLSSPESNIHANVQTVVTLKQYYARIGVFSAIWNPYDGCHCHNVIDRCTLALINKLKHFHLANMASKAVTHEVE